MVQSWDASATGVLCLPSGRVVRGRALRQPLPAGASPTYALYLLDRPPPAVPWEARWVRWPDWRLPRDRADAADAIRDAWTRAEAQRVEVVCAGGRGRTGTVLACMAILDGVPAEHAVSFVRVHYDRHAVETPWQRRYARSFARR